MKSSEQTKQTGLTKRTPALKGAVLIMVMTVMFVLIFLLAGTIAVVYSAHNRAMLKYEESQAYYTARSTLDAYLDAFLKDNDNRTGDNSTVGVTYYYFDTTTSPVTLDNVNAKQGRALELDIYGLKVSVAPKGAGGLADADYPYDGVTESIWSVGGYVNDKYLYDWVKQYILDLALGDFNVPAGQTLEDFRDDYATNNAASYGAARTLAMKAINSKISDYNHTDTSLITSDSLNIENHAGYKPYYQQFTVSETGDTLYYRVPANTFSTYGNAGTSGSFGKVADTFADNATDAIITVQLLERTMNLSKDGADYKLKFDGGNREKDHVKIKVTCEIMLDGVSTTTSVIYANEYVQKPSSNKAIVSLSDIKGSDSVTAFGGAVSMATEGFNWTNNSGTSGNVYLRSDVNFGTTDPKVVLNKSNVFYTDKSIIVSSNAPTMTYVESGATYMADKIVVGQKGLGATGHEINAVCREFEYNQTSGGSARVVGQLFTEDFIATAGMGNNTDIVDGAVYTNYITFNENDVQLTWDTAASPPSLTIGIDKQQSGADRQSDMSFSHLATGNINIAKGIKVKLNTGDTIIADINGTVTYPATGGTTYNVQIGSSTAMAGKLGYDTSKVVKATNKVKDTDSNGTPEASEQDFTYDTSSKSRTFTMPANLIGKSDGKLEIDTLEKMYADYFKAAATTGGSYDGEPFAYFGDFNYGTYNEANHMKAFDSADANGTISSNLLTFMEEHIVQPQDRNNKVDNTGLSVSPLFNALTVQTAPDADIQAAVTASGKQLAGVITADCQIPSKDQMNINNVYNCIDNYVFVVDTRGGPVNLQMGNGSGGTFAGNFMVVGTNKCTMLMPASSANTEFILGDDHDFSLFDSRLGQRPANLRLGMASNPSTPPAIDIVVSKNVSKVTYGQHSAGPIQGYVYAPYSKFSVGGGNNGSGSTIHVDMFSDGNAVGNFAISVIGSIFCKGYDNAQKIGVAFIDPNTVTTPPGDKVFAWSDVYYQRGV